MDVRIAEDGAAVAEMAAASVAGWLRAASGPVDLGLAGGGTPEATYRLLAEESAPWSRVDVWMSDERFVAPDHPDSNAGMARRALLDHVPARFYPTPWEPGLAAGDAAERYERTLRSFLRDEDGALRPRLVLLGMGDDGHTASLFPGSDALEVDDRPYAATWVAAKETWRLTATLPLLAGTDRIVFLVTGSAKADMVATVLEGDTSLPARLVCDAAADVVWMIDQAAAAKLRRHRPV